MAVHARGFHHVEFVMGMAVSIDVRDPVDESVIAEVVSWLHQVDADYSTYKLESPISRFGRGELTVDDLGPEMISVLILCEDLCIDTDGAFDVFAVPAPNGTTFDPSGVVKGWSIERAAEILEGRGIANFCINGGGDIALRGEHSPGVPWRVGIRHPGQSMMSAAVVAVSGRCAIATSATYERGAHIINPATGEPTTEVASVTIIGPDLTFADAYATAVFVMGVDGLNWLADRHPDYAGFVITHNETTYQTDNFAGLQSSPASHREGVIATGS